MEDNLKKLELSITKAGGKYTRCTNAEALSQLFLEIEQERALLIGKGVLLLGDGKDIK